MLKHGISQNKKRSDGCMEAEAGSPSHAVVYAAKTSTGQEIILSGAGFC